MEAQWDKISSRRTRWNSNLIVVEIAIFHGSNYSFN
jgi:hypothetical protein